MKLRKRVNKQWKGVKWIDTPFANKYKYWMHMARMRCLSVLATAKFKVDVIASTAGDKGARSMRCRQVIIDAYVLMISIYNEANRKDIYCDGHLDR